MSIEKKDPPRGGKFYNYSPLVQAADQVMREGEIGQWYQVMTYENRASAGATSSRLRERHSPQWPKGHWEIIGRELPTGDGSALYFKYNGPADEIIIDNKPNRGGFRRQLPNPEAPEDLEHSYGSVRDSDLFKNP